MTDTKKLREPAERWSRLGYVNMVVECVAIIEILDRLERYEELLRTNAEFFQSVQGSMGKIICERWATDAAIKEFEIREALEGGKP